MNFCNYFKCYIHLFHDKNVFKVFFPMRTICLLCSLNSDHVFPHAVRCFKRFSGQNSHRMQSDSHALDAGSKCPTGCYPCQQLSPFGVEVRTGSGIWDLGSQFGQGKGEWIADTIAPGFG